MKYIDADLLRKEIEKRLKAEYNEKISSSLMSESLVCMGKVEVLNKLLSYLDPLQVDEPEGLDEAADKYLDTQDVAEMFCGDYEGWQIVNAFKAGAEWQKTQMMKDAVEAYVNTYEQTGGKSYVEFVADLPISRLFHGRWYKERDKVKLIIVKEESK